MIPEIPIPSSISSGLAVSILTAIEPYHLLSSSGINYYILPPELNYLASIEEDPISPLPPEFTIIAAFDSKGLAARTTMISVPHMEGTWIREDLRKGRVGVTLVREVEKCIAASDKSNLIAFTPDADRRVEGYMSRLGYKKLPVSVWVKYNIQLDEESHEEK